MALSTPVLYGAKEFATNPGATYGNLYAAALQPQAFSITLSESITDTDSDVFRNTKVLSDSSTLTDAQIKSILHTFSDSLTGSDAATKSLIKVLSDSGAITDSRTVLVAVKNLSDFLVLKEWIAVKQIKSINWVNPQVNENQVDSLYAKGAEGPVLYGATKSLFGGVKPTSTWTAGAKRSENWSQANGSKYNY